MIPLLFRLALTFAPMAIVGWRSPFSGVSFMALVFFEAVAALAPDEAPLRFMAWVLWLVVALVYVGLAVLS